MDEIENVKLKQKISWKQFFIGLGLVLIPLSIIEALIIFLKNDLSGLVYGLLLLMITPIIGLIVLLILKKKNRSKAIGFMIGSFLPFAFIFLATGGCGLIRL